MSVLVQSSALAEGSEAKKGEDIHSFHRVDPYTAVKQMGAGWNLGNTLDAIPTEGSWSPPVTEDTFDHIKAAGFQSVRLPVTWTHHMGEAPDYTVDPVWMDRVSEVVDMALERGFYVVLNVHHDSWEWANLSNQDNLEEKHRKLKILWKQIAERFKNRSEKLIFETLNEPQGSTIEDANQYNLMNKNIVEVIRNSGGYNQERLILLPGLNTNIEKTIDWFKNPDPADRNLMLTVHNYDPWNFVSRYWGTTYWDNREYFDVLFGKLDAFSDQIGLPVIIGEYGTLASGTVEHHSKWVYTDRFVRAAHKYGMATMVWDIGIDHFDRENKVWVDPICRDIILNASKGIRNSFVDKASIYLRDGVPITDQVLQLELNGNKLENVYHGSTQLKKGEDYSLEGSVLTLNGKYLSTLVQDLGVQATLKFKFNEGAEQSLDIIKFKAPEMAVTEVTIEKGSVADDLKIPTLFNGTSLATVTALELNTIDYQTGTPLPMPVKDEWTNFMPNNAFDGLRGGLNFNDDFRSDATNVYISKNVLNLMNDDAVFSFKFWPRDQEVNVDVIVRVK
ncbi:cellulase family glycosylhydrolase [Paenibacillus oralis]|uniref:cellulase family glycosylhydrolase n=1 Tax=Paenibacillus oralis TaxID=2490856 RepID=UPI0015ACF60D|nr:cellulase family glycosylhydrolase [Paenibacillus oralis]